MADLDDFFAKKDKKKKGTKKFSKANTEVIAKKLIETEKKELNQQDKELGTQLSEEKVSTNTHEDEEWDDYRENKKDFTGLKIETLNIDDKEEEEEEEEDTEINEDGEVVTKKKDESGPWNKAGGGSGNTGEPQQEVVREPEPSIQMSNVVGGSYVPPHMRGGNAAPPPERRAQPRGGRNRNAPDITNELYFPSLSSAADDSGPKGAWGKPGGGLASRQDYGGGYEEVTGSSGGGKASHSRNTEAPRLQLDNKFAALRDGD